MKKIRLLFRYSKIYGSLSFILILQYLFIFLYILTSMNYFTNSYDNYMLSKTFPINKMVYFSSVELAINEEDIKDIKNIDEIIVNNEKLEKIIAGYKSISSVFPIVKNGVINFNSKMYGVVFLDKNSFNILADKNITDENDNNILAISQGVRDSLELDKVYPMRLEINDKFEDIKVKLVGKTKVGDNLLSSNVITNSELTLSEINQKISNGGIAFYLYVPENLNISINDKKNIEKYLYNQGFSFSRLVYFEENTDQTIINDFIKRVEEARIGYPISNEDIMLNQKEELNDILNSRADLVFGFLVILVFSLFTIVFISYKKIEDFRDVMEILGFNKRKSLLINIIYNFLVFFVAVLLFAIYAYFSNKAGNTFYPYKILSKEFSIIFSLFLLVNLFLSLFLYYKDKRKMEVS